MMERNERQTPESSGGVTPCALTAFGELPPETWVDKAWMMNVFGCAERTIERAVQDGRVKACSYGFIQCVVKIGGRTFIDPDALSAWAEERNQQWTEQSK